MNLNRALYNAGGDFDGSLMPVVNLNQIVFHNIAELESNLFHHEGHSVYPLNAYMVGMP